jgi:serine/threonine-protein kinase RsbT
MSYVPEPRTEEEEKTPVNESRIPIERESDIVVARQAGRKLAADNGFSTADQTLIATAISEVARNIVVYALKGEVVVSQIADGVRVGIQVIARDHGPGIENLDLAMRDGLSTKNSLGLGLPGARRLMDDFDLKSELGHGTTVTMKKWRP